MPRSAKRIKVKIIKYITDILENKDSSILDCGPGTGIYSVLLSNDNKRIYKNMDCCEIYEPYINKYKLHDKYRNVYLSNICDLQFKWYDMIIMGDILEHIETEKAQKLLNNIYDKCKHLLIMVPYLYEQGPYKGNIYETHLQPDLTHKIFLERYTGFKRELEMHNIGMYIKKE